ncbi:MAG: nuclear transport factor 2 family protein [Actinomycetes bacterium]
MSAFRDAVEARDLDALEAALAEDVVFRSPAVYKPYEGRPATMVILRAVMRVFEDFRYVRETASADGRDHVLVFEATVKDKQLEGVDVLHLDEDGLVDDLRVLVRPLSGLNGLVEAMGQAIPEVMRELGLDPGDGGAPA